MESATVTVRKTRKRTARIPTPSDVVVDQPFVRMTRNKVQMTLNRDTLAALGRPTHIIWKEMGDGFMRLQAATVESEGAYAISYFLTRPSAVVTIPTNHRNLLRPGEYMVVSWAEKDETEKWVEFSLRPELYRIPQGRRKEGTENEKSK